MINKKTLVSLALSVLTIKAVVSCVNEDLESNYSFRKYTNINKADNEGSNSLPNLFLSKVLNFLDLKEISYCEQVSKGFLIAARSFYIDNIEQEKKFWGINMNVLPHPDNEDKTIKHLYHMFYKAKSIHCTLNSGNINLIYLLANTDYKSSLRPLDRLVELKSEKAINTYRKGMHIINFLRGSLEYSVI